jgi:folate-dependent tRNA-U54 methylase TrmFO/GidA
MVLELVCSNSLGSEEQSGKRLLKAELEIRSNLCSMLHCRVRRLAVDGTSSEGW